MTDEQTDPAVLALANTLSTLPHPGGQDLRLVLFDGASDAVKQKVAEGIIHFLRRNHFMPHPKTSKPRRK
ncbi:hypothetical protein [Nocardia terpenica]|uniref:Uncharacterized protein n=1 Tax=Nocardia terpenica TaxID=455432 RepID=A0A164K1N1_9NOCA|nr:hypothetical protein [Nocardia terpenica]KZM70936.1 hypothetical protein AWN90_41160 [Nocardia terpenica]NQE89755.1 hypothetical protein [Nocardia terpenica]